MKKVLKSLVKKECYQIIRDPSSISIAFILPLVLMLIFAYGINLDNNTIKVGILVEDSNSKASEIVSSFEGTTSLDLKKFSDRKSIEKSLVDSEIKGMIIIPNDFTKKLYNNSTTADLQLILDGSDPNMSTFIEGYVLGSLAKWQSIKLKEKGQNNNNLLNIETTTWYNPELKSINFILPSSIAIIMTLVGIVLTALVIAREWERGTMEAILTTKVTKMDILLSKYIAYYFLTLCSAIFCTFMCVFLFKIPFHGSYLIYFITSSLFIFTALGQGLLISTLSTNQFLASICAATFGLLPSTMLSGMLFEISSMPKFVQLFTYLIPARYFTVCIRNLFNAGNIWGLIIPQSIFMLVFSTLNFILVYRKTKTRLE